jgi:hypothetical protein
MPKHWLDQRLEELESQGKSKSGLARALGLPSSRVSEMISGVRAIKAKELRPMADYLEWSMDALAAYINTGKPSPGAVAAGKEQVGIGDDPGGAQEVEFMTPDTEVITEVYEHLDPQRRRELRQHAWKLLNEQVGAAEGAKPGPTRARRS